MGHSTFVDHFHHLWTRSVSGHRLRRLSLWNPRYHMRSWPVYTLCRYNWCSEGRAQNFTNVEHSVFSPIRVEYFSFRWPWKSFLFLPWVFKYADCLSSLSFAFYLWALFLWETCFFQLSVHRGLPEGHYHLAFQKHSSKSFHW